MIVKETFFVFIRIEKTVRGVLSQILIPMYNAMERIWETLFWRNW